MRPLQRHEIEHMPLKFKPNSIGSKPRRVVCYGDSLTAGFCSLGAQFEPYGRTLVKELDTSGVPCEIVVSGHSGKTAEEMVAALDSSIRDVVGFEGRGLTRILDEDVASDLVIIMAGTNDMGMGAAPDTIVKHIAQLHAACHSRGVPTSRSCLHPRPAHHYSERRTACACDSSLQSGPQTRRV